MSTPEATNGTSRVGHSTASANDVLSFAEFRELYEAELRKRQDHEAAAGPAANPPPQQRGGRARAMAMAGANRGAAFFFELFPNWHVPFRLCLASMMITGRMSLRAVLTATVAYVLFTVVKLVLSTVQLRRRRGGRNAYSQGPTALGDFFLQMGGANQDATYGGGDGGQPQERPRLSFAVRTGYTTVKCLEALVLSFYPFYSVENLERELLRDGIVVDNTPVRAQTRAEAAAAAAANRDL